MTYEATGVLFTSFLAFICVWIVSFFWSISDIIKNKKPKKWLLVSIILPVLGAILYHLYERNAGKSKRHALLRSATDRWVVFALIIIMLLSMYVRLVDYRWPYIRNIDSFVYYRWMDEIVQNNGVLPYHDKYILSPVGQDRQIVWINPYQYIGAYSYILLNALVSTSLMNFLIFFPAFLATLSAIPAYYIGKYLYDRKAGVLAAFFYTFEVSNISRSLGGDADLDAMTIMFQILVMAFFIYNLKLAEKTERYNKKLWLSVIVTTAVFWLWYHLWAGYWYLTWLITGFMMVKLIMDYVRTRNFSFAKKPVYTSFVIILIVPYILMSIVSGPAKITSAIFGPIDFSNIKGEATTFPNVYVSVAELQSSGGPKEIIARTSAMGGPWIVISPFFLMIYALIYLFYSFYKTRKHYDTAVLLILWFLGPFIATLVAVRFSILFSASLTIGSAIIFSKLIRMTTGEDKNFSD